MENEREHKKFGEIAIEMKFATEEQVEKALKYQAVIKLRHGDKVPLGRIMLHKGYLTQNNIDFILSKQGITLKKKKKKDKNKTSKKKKPVREFPKTEVLCLPEARPRSGPIKETNVPEKIEDSDTKVKESEVGLKTELKNREETSTTHVKDTEEGLITKVKEPSPFDVEETEKRKTRFRKIYTQALQKIDSRDIKTQVHDVHKQKRPITTPLASIKETPLDKKADRFIKRGAIVCGLSILLIIIVVIYNGMKIKPLPDSLKDPKQIVVSNPSTPTNPPVIMTPDPAKAFISELHEKLLQPKPPSQRYLNSILKQIYINSKSYLSEKDPAPSAGDIYNIYARLYYYKVYLDQESQLFNSELKKEWLEEAIELLKKAKQAYSNANSKTYFHLLLMPWMPEKNWFKDNRILSYNSTKEAMQDVDFCITTFRKEIQ